MHATQHPTILFLINFNISFPYGLQLTLKRGIDLMKSCLLLRIGMQKRSGEHSACAAYLRHWNKNKIVVLHFYILFWSYNVAYSRMQPLEFRNKEPI